MRILLSNDDGYFAPGLERLAAALAERAEVTQRLEDSQRLVEECEAELERNWVPSIAGAAVLGIQLSIMNPKQRGRVEAMKRSAHRLAKAKAGNELHVDALGGAPR